MQTIERTILTALITDMAKKGFHVAACWDGEEYQLSGRKTVSHAKAPETVKAFMSLEEAIESVDSVDISTLHFTQQNKRTWGNRGVMIVLGNGEDCISDYHCADSEPDFGSVIEAIYWKLNQGFVL